MSITETQPVTFKTYAPSSAEGLKKFITQFPRLPYGIEHFDSFAQNLISSHDCVLDLWQGNQRVAAAALLDKAQGKSQALEIAILGYRWDFSASAFLEAVLPLAIKKAQQQNKKHLEIISSLGLKVAPSDLTRKNFVAGTTTITFETTQTNPSLLVSVPPQWEWKDADQESVKSGYELIKMNVPVPEASNLVPFEQFEKLALLLPIKPRILFEKNLPIAFVWVALENQTGQLLFIARHPDYRAKGLGKVCLGEATRLLKPFGFKKLQAEVKETDLLAIKLFDTCGFRTTRKLTRFILPVT